MEKRLEYKNIPYGYELCFNDKCQLRDKCMHYQAYLLKPDERLVGPTVYPSAWKDGNCLRFNEKKLVQKAWGFSQLYKNVPYYRKAEARRCVKNYFSHGNGPYYRYHHGENKLSPSQQEDIMAILAKFGSTDGLTFDHYETDFDFSGEHLIHIHQVQLRAAPFFCQITYHKQQKPSILTRNTQELNKLCIMNHELGIKIIIFATKIVV